MESEQSFVGLDLSLTGSGLCRYRPFGPAVPVTDPAVHELKLIGTSPRDFPDRWRRYDHIAEEIRRFLSPSPRLIVLEDYVLCPGNVRTTMALIEMGAVVRRTLAETGLPWITIVGSQLKKWLTGRGVGHKSLIMKDVYKQLHLDVDDDNLADAAVLAHVAFDLHQLKHWNKLPEFKYREEVVKKVLKTREVINADKWQ